MIAKIILLILCIAVSAEPIVAQQEDVPKKFFDFLKNREVTDQCDYESVFEVVLGFSQYLAYDQQKRVWRECEDEIVEYIIFVHLSPGYKVDSVDLMVIGPRTDVVLSAFDTVKTALNEMLSEWPSCDIPVQFASESWTVVLPFSFYSMSFPKHIQFPRTATRNLKNAISHFATSNLSVVYPIGVLGWSVTYD